MGGGLDCAWLMAVTRHTNRKTKLVGTLQVFSLRSSTTGLRSFLIGTSSRKYIIRVPLNAREVLPGSAGTSRCKQLSGQRLWDEPWLRISSPGPAAEFY